MEKRRVTIRDIAEATGCHFTTVGLALKNSPKIKAATREKIQAAAERLGYRPDPMVTALNAYRHAKRVPHFQAVLAWINNWPNRGHLTRIPSFREYYRGVCDRAAKLGYIVEEFWTHEPGMNLDRLTNILLARNVQALLLAPQPRSQTELPIDYSKFSVICFGYSMQPAKLHVVTNHHFHSMNLMVTKLLELGYRRLGLCVGVEWDRKVEHAWLGGLMLAQSVYPDLEPIPPFYGETGRHKEQREWIEKHRPDVIISYDLVVRDIRAIGYRVPEDLGFASLDLDPLNAEISGVDENNFLIGQKAVDLLVDMIHRGERGVPPIPVRTLVESTWIPGSTLKDLNKGKRKPRN